MPFKKVLYDVDFTFLEKTLNIDHFIKKELIDQI